MSFVQKDLAARNVRLARRKWGPITPFTVSALRAYSNEFGFSVALGEVVLLDHVWYVTHSGLLRLARRKRCVGIEGAAIAEFCDRASDRYAFKATVFTSRTCKGFVGHGDADPSNVVPLASGEALLHPATFDSRAARACRAFDLGASLLHCQSRMEARLVPPGFPL
jgi:hypothetical protein